jgi:hypothetical protein
MHADARGSFIGSHLFLNIESAREQEVYSLSFLFPFFFHNKDSSRKPRSQTKQTSPSMFIQGELFLVLSKRCPSLTLLL